MPSDAVQFTPQILHQKKGLIKLHNPGKFPEDNICSSHFRDSQRVSVRPQAIILDKFWVFFHGLLPQMRSNLYKMFTINAKQGNASHIMVFNVV